MPHLSAKSGRNKSQQGEHLLVAQRQLRNLNDSVNKWSNLTLLFIVIDNYRNCFLLPWDMHYVKLWCSQATMFCILFYTYFVLQHILVNGCNWCLGVETNDTKLCLQRVTCVIPGTWGNTSLNMRQSKKTNE